MTTTTEPAVQEFLDGIRVPNTQMTYRRTFNVFAQWSGQEDGPKDDLQVQEFLNWREDIGRAAATVAVDCAALVRFLTWQGKSVRRIEKRPVVMQEPKYLPRDEIKALIAAAEEEHLIFATILAVLYDTGARIGEVLNLRFDGIDQGGSLQVLRKGGRVEWTNCTNYGMEYLRRWLELRAEPRNGVEKVFGDLSLKFVAAHFNKHAKKAGIAHFTPHMMRHSRAVHLHEQGVSWENIGYQLGHVNASTTINTYGRPTAQDMKVRIPEPKL